MTDLERECLGLLEWVQWASYHDESSSKGACPACYGDRTLGHDDGCEIAEMIARLEERSKVGAAGDGPDALANIHRARLNLTDGVSSEHFVRGLREGGRR